MPKPSVFPESATPQIIVMVSGGVAEVVHNPDQISTLVFDLDAALDSGMLPEGLLEQVAGTALEDTLNDICPDLVGQDEDEDE